jgi:hypothetical protein
MPAFQFETNLPVILLIIVIALISLYFYLDLKKVKLVNEELEKKNEMVVKEIDNIHLRLHKFFSGMPRGVVPIPKMSQTTPKAESNNKEVKENLKNEVSTTVEKMIDETVNSTEISEDEINITNNNKSSNNIFGEIQDIISNDNNIIQEKEPINLDMGIVLPELAPVAYDSEKITEVKETDEEVDEEEDEVNDVSEENDSEDEELSDDLDEDLLDQYMKKSVKELKEKCIEMNLKHSGNKTTLARRIVENLE